MALKLRAIFSLQYIKSCSIIGVVCWCSLVGIAQVAKNEAHLNTGIASWYSDSFEGRKTASGEKFSQKKLTCASNQYKMGTWLRVTNVRNGKSVVVKVNDRMSPRMKRIVDLSRAAAQKLDIIGHGLCKVSVEKLGSKQP